MSKSANLLVAAIAVTGALTACVSSPGDDLPKFGATVSAAKDAQIWREGDAAPTLDGDRASRKMETYRKRGETSAKAAEGVSIDISAK